MSIRLALALSLAMAGSAAVAGAPETKITPVAAADLPAAVLAVVTKAAPGLKVVEAELKEREDRRYFDVEGVLPSGAEIEFDLLEKNGAWEIVETQRDIAQGALATAPSDRVATRTTAHRPSARRTVTSCVAAAASQRRSWPTCVAG